MKGVIAAPFTFYSCASLRAVSIANQILSLCTESSSGIGTVTRIPDYIYNYLVAWIILTTSNGVSTQIGDFTSEDEKKKSGIKSD